MQMHSVCLCTCLLCVWVCVCMFVYICMCVCLCVHSMFGCCWSLRSRRQGTRHTHIDLFLLGTLQVIKARVKELMIPRYKIICLVHIGQLGDQSVRISSRCLWDQTNDTYASSEFRNKSLYAVASVYGVYYEWISRALQVSLVLLWELVSCGWLSEVCWNFMISLHWQTAVNKVQSKWWMTFFTLKDES